MYVYRIATKSELGPYQGGVCNARHYDDDHPAPDDDGIPYNVRWEYTHNYGFSSKEQLLGWFTKSDLRRFEQQDFYVWRYSVPKSAVHFGGKQVAFDIKRATERKRIDRKEFSSIPLAPVTGRVTPAGYLVPKLPPFGRPEINAFLEYLLSSFLKKK